MDLDLKKEYYDRNKRWSELTLNQLSSYNNLIFSLSLGFFAFCFDQKNLKKSIFSLSNIEYSKTFLFLSIVLILFSIILGLLISITRLNDFRITRQINQIRQRVYEHSNSKLDENSTLDYSFFKSIILVLKKKPIISMEECKNYKNIENFDTKFNELRTISHNLGKSTWNLTIVQSIFFGLSTLLYFISIIL